MRKTKRKTGSNALYTRMTIGVLLRTTQQQQCKCDQIRFKLFSLDLTTNLDASQIGSIQSMAIIDDSRK